MGVTNIKEKEKETGLATLSKFEFDKAALAEKLQDYKNYVVAKETLPQATKALSKVRGWRFNVQNTLDANKTILNTLKKSEQDKADEFIKMILEVEAPIAAAIKVLEDAKLEEKRKADQAEKERLAKIEQDRKDEEDKKLQAEKDRLEEIRLSNEKKEKELKQQEADLKARQDALLKQEQDAIDKKKREQEEADAKIKADNYLLTQEMAKVKKQKTDNRVKELLNLGLTLSDGQFKLKTSLGEFIITSESAVFLNDDSYEKLIEALTIDIKKQISEDKIVFDEREAEIKKEQEAADKLKEEQEAIRLESLKSEKEKLLYYANEVLPWNEIPKVTSPEAKEITANIRVMLERIQKGVIESVQKLK